MVEKGMQPQSIVGGNSITKSGKVTELWVSCFVSIFAAVGMTVQNSLLFNAYELLQALQIDRATTNEKLDWQFY